MGRIDRASLGQMDVAGWLACAGLALLTWCWMQHRSLAGLRQSYQLAVRQVEEMDDDARRIEALRSAPRLATERQRPNDELIAEIHKALEAAGIPPGNWVGNEPAAPVRVPRSAYKRLSVRLMFEEISLRMLVQFVHHLSERDAGLSMGSLRLRSPTTDGSEEIWNAELVVSYLLYAPGDGATSATEGSRLPLDRGKP